MARPGYYTGGANELPVGCIIVLAAVMIPIGLASVAFEIWWKWALVMALVHPAHS